MKDLYLRTNYTQCILGNFQYGGEVPQHSHFCKHFEGIWNNYIYIQQKNMQVRFIIFLSTRGCNSLGDPMRSLKEKYVLKYKLNQKHQPCIDWSSDIFVVECIWPNLMWKWPTWTKLYIANMIMNVSGTVCQLIHYFPSEQESAINLPWPALKSKQCTPHVLNLFTSSAFNCLGGEV